MGGAELANKTFIDAIWIKLFEARRDRGLQNFKEELNLSDWKDQPGNEM